MSKRNAVKIWGKMLCLLVIAFLLLTGCGILGGGGQDVPSDDSGNYAIKVGLITGQDGIEDIYSEKAWEGLQKAQQELNAGIGYVKVKNDKDYPSGLAELKSQDCQVIFTIGSAAIPATLEAAEKNPKITYVCLDSTIEGTIPDNVLAVSYRVEEAAFLAGYLAAKRTETNVVGVILGDNKEAAQPYFYGFKSGVRFVNPNCELLKGNAATFTNKTRVEEMAEAMVNSDADVIFHSAGLAGKAMIEVMEEKGKYAIGADIDQNGLAPETVLTSVIKENGEVAYSIIKQIEENTLASGKNVSYGLAENAVGLAETTESMVSEETYTKINEYKQKIIDGKITVPANENETFKITY
ncbi:MAG: BMP family ABC transporter substrate-binding protein [Dehalobacter sp. 4CP]|uniref:BMP family lipoprotein n=1 Tax=Dehalobacter sp. CP TaxID=2594474 RepID=UPI0013C5FEF1|nr:BMP family ABC transporter substrate-binding protein [Dehalobacter sp. 4CP]